MAEQYANFILDSDVPAALILQSATAQDPTPCKLRCSDKFQECQR